MPLDRVAPESANNSVAYLILPLDRRSKPKKVNAAYMLSVYIVLKNTLAGDRQYIFTAFIPKVLSLFNAIANPYNAQAEKTKAEFEMRTPDITRDVFKDRNGNALQTNADKLRIAAGNKGKKA